MSDYQVDRLEISAESNLEKVNTQLDATISKLGQLANTLKSSISKDAFSGVKKSFEDMGKSVSNTATSIVKSAERVSEGLGKSAKNAESVMKRASESMSSGLQLKGTPKTEQIIGESTQQNLNNAVVSIREVKALLDSMDKPTGIGQRYSEDFLKLKDNIEKTTEKLEHYRAKQEQANRLGFNTDTQSAKKLADNIDLTEKKLQQYVSDLERMKKDGNVVADQGKGFVDLSKDISFAGTMLSKFGNVLKTLNFTALGDSVKQIGRLFNNTASIASNAGQKMSQVGSKASEGMATAGSAIGGLSAKLSGALSKVPIVGWVIVAVIGAIALNVAKLKVVFAGFSSVVKGTVNLFTKLWTTAGKALKSIISIGSEGYQAITPLGKLINRIIKMFKSKIIRKLVSIVFKDVLEGFNKLNAYSEEFGTPFHRSMSVIFSDLKYVGRAVATLVEPLINVLAPALDFVINKVVDLMNVVNQFLNNILGSDTWTKATYVLQDYGEEADSASGKVAKLNKQLRAFDEINNITVNDPNKGSGGGNADDLAVEKMFSTENVSQKIKDFVQRVKDAWNTDADFTSIGRDIGNWFRDCINSVDFEKIKTDAGKLGKSLATGLSGFLTTPSLADDIGTKIAEAFNTAIEFVTNFVENMNFGAIGTFVGRGVASALSNINFEDLKKSALRLGQGLAQAINNLASTDAIAEIGKATANILMLGINFAYGVLSSTNFDELGKSVAEGISNFFKQLNEVDPETGLTGFEKLGKALNNLAHGITEFFVNAVKNIDEDEVAQGFADFFNELDLSGIAIDVAVLTEAIKTKILEAIAKAFIDLGEEKFGNKVPYKLGVKFQVTIEDFIEKIKKLISKKADSSKGSELAVEIGVNDPTEKIRTIWNGILAFWQSKTPLKTISFTVENVRNKVVNAWNSVLNYWRSRPLLNTITTTVEDVRSKVANMWYSVQSWWNSKPSLINISVGINNIKQMVINAWNDLQNWWNNNKPNLSAIGTNIKLPHIVLDSWDVTSNMAKAVKTLFNVHGIPKFKVSYYAQGGFPEDGWFRASQGEMMGKFDNGKSVVANNKQITEGIAQAVREGNTESNLLIRQEIEMLRKQNEYLLTLTQKEYGIKDADVFKSVRKMASQYTDMTGNPAFPI